MMARMWVRIGSRRLAGCSRGSWWCGGVVLVSFMVWELCVCYGVGVGALETLVTGARVMCFGCLDSLVEMVFCHGQHPISTPACFCNGYWRV